MVGQQVKYSKIEPEMRSRDLKHAIENLVQAGVIYQIFATTASGLPLSALINEKKFGRMDCKRVLVLHSVVTNAYPDPDGKSITLVIPKMLYS